MKRFGKFAGLFLAAVLTLYVSAPPLFAVAALGAQNALMAFGMSYELAKYITGNMVNVDANGNLILPMASAKRISYTAAGTEVAFTNSSGINSQNGFAFPTTAEEAVAGAGSTNADAAALSATKHVHQLTGANGTLGWIFAASTAGQFEFLLNTTAGVPKIYANTGGTCNGGATNAACTLVTGIVAHLCYSTAVDTWICS